jgi:histidinol-phosphate aminotransferase
VFVCSPNNPTGQRAAAVGDRGSLAGRPTPSSIVDEAYIEFAGATCLPLVADHPNIVVTRTFSKAFALAGARIGYCARRPARDRDLQRVRLPYHLSALTQAAGVAALRHREGSLGDARRDPRATRPDPARAPRDPGVTVIRPTRTSSVRAARCRTGVLARLARPRRARSATCRPSCRTRSA